MYANRRKVIQRQEPKAINIYRGVKPRTPKKRVRSPVESLPLKTETAMVVYEPPKKISRKNNGENTMIMNEEGKMVERVNLSGNTFPGIYVPKVRKPTPRSVVPSVKNVRSRVTRGLKTVRTGIQKAPRTMITTLFPKRVANTKRTVNSVMKNLDIRNKNLEKKIRETLELSFIVDKNRAKKMASAMIEQYTKSKRQESERLAQSRKIKTKENVRKETEKEISRLRLRQLARNLDTIEKKMRVLEGRSLSINDPNRPEKERELRELQAKYVRLERTFIPLATLFRKRKRQEMGEKLNKNISNALSSGRMSNAKKLLKTKLELNLKI
jgi:hypothetical protein